MISNKNFVKILFMGFFLVHLVFCVKTPYALLDENKTASMVDFEIYNSENELIPEADNYIIKNEEYHFIFTGRYISSLIIYLNDSYHGMELIFDNGTQLGSLTIYPYEENVISLLNTEITIWGVDNQFSEIIFDVVFGNNIIDSSGLNITWVASSDKTGEHIEYEIYPYEHTSNYQKVGFGILSQHGYSVTNNYWRSSEGSYIRFDADDFDVNNLTVVFEFILYENTDYSEHNTDYRHVIWGLGEYGTYFKHQKDNDYEGLGLSIGKQTDNSDVLHLYKIKDGSAGHTSGWAIEKDVHYYVWLKCRGGKVWWYLWTGGFNGTKINHASWDYLLFNKTLSYSFWGAGYGLVDDDKAKTWVGDLAYKHEASTWDWCYSNTTYTRGETGYTVNFFNLGGMVSYVKVGDAGHNKGDDILSIYAQDVGSYIEASIIWDKLQHQHLTLELDNGGVWDSINNKFINMTGGLYEFGMNYFINNTILNGWKTRIYVESSDVGNHGVGVDKDWVNWEIEHYIYNRTIDDWMIKKESNLISNYDGYDHTSSIHGYTNKTTIKFFVDLWFSNENSSKIIATRINPEFFGMYEQGSSFWFGYGAFRPYFGDETVSIFYDNIYDGNMNVVSSSEKVSLVQFWVRVEKITGKEKYQLTNFVMKNSQFASYKMGGIDTPAYVATKVINMPRTGFLTPLVKAIQGIGSLIWGACMGFIYVLISSIDGLLVYLGLPEGMVSSMIGWVSIQASTIWSWISTVTSYTVDMLYVFVQLANFIISFMGYILSAITWVVIWVLPIPLHIFLFILAIITSGSWTYGGYTWDFSAYSDITGAFWAIAPYMIAWGFSVWLFLGRGDDIGGFPHRLMDTFRFIKEGYTNLFWIFNHMRNEIITMYNFVRSHIPFLGSGGGETEE